MRLMIVSQDESFTADLARHLHSFGFGADVFTTLADVDEALAGSVYALLLLDPRVHDKKDTTWWRNSSRLKYSGSDMFLILIADSQEERIAALEAGADDCVTRGTGNRELTARIRAVLRRPRVQFMEKQVFCDVSLCMFTREVCVGEQVLPLQKRETFILQSLMRRRGQVMPRAGLEHDVYGAQADYCPNSLEVRVSRIRRQLAKAGSCVTIETVRGIGYRLASRQGQEMMGREALGSTRLATKASVRRMAMVTASVISAMVSSAYAQTVVGARNLTFSVGGGRLIHLPHEAGNIMIADPSIMDVQYADKDNLFAFGKKAGHTTLIVQDQGGQTMISGSVTVSPNMDALREAVAAEGGRDVQVQMSPEGVLLSGRVPNASAAAHLTALARQYGGPGGKVVNRLTIGEPVQVSLQVRVAEVQRQVSQDLGFNWTTVFSNVGSFAIGAATGGLSGVPSAISAASSAANAVSGQYRSGSGSVTGTLDAMASEGLATMLAEPNLTTMSGESAKFLSGGQFPVPVPQGFGTVGVTYKNYGVSVDFTPTVLSDGMISMHVAPEVSSVSTEAADGAYSIAGSSGGVVPAIRTNRADTTIQLASGQSFAIGGLISNDSSNTVSKVPGLGDIPVLGALFRSASFQRNESELLIVVTAYIVHPSDHIPSLVTDYVRPASAFEALLLNRTTMSASGIKDPVRLPHLQGAAGFLYQ